MPSITTWTRLEPRSRGGDLRESLQAQVRDPLWLLARQWQLGEFDGEDAGSPVRADLEYEFSEVDGYIPWRAPDGPAQDYNAAEAPLEVIVEQEGLATGGDAWDPERLEYRFDVTAPAKKKDGSDADAPLRLHAREYHGGRLDWWAFDADIGAAEKLAKSESLVTQPTGIRYHGMPSSRFWAFEATAVDFGGIETAPTDLAKLIFAEFALAYGNDFFLVPLELNIGAVARITRLGVTDTFGQFEDIRPASEVDRAGAGNAPSPWRLYSLTSSGGQLGDLLFLTPALVGDLHGEPLEEVVFLRDEMANVAWAVENRVTGESGRGYSPQEADELARQAARDAKEAKEGVRGPAGGALTYKLFTPVPDHWRPLLRRQVSQTDSRVVFKLRGGAAIRGQLLGEHANGATPIYEEEIPRGGLRLRRVPQYARWRNGRTFSWVGRLKGPGPGQGDSGLQFDVLAPAEMEE